MLKRAYLESISYLGELFERKESCNISATDLRYVTRSLPHFFPQEMAENAKEACGARLDEGPGRRTVHPLREAQLRSVAASVCMAVGTALHILPDTLKGPD